MVAVDAENPPPVRLLFVCWGNICRSPTAEGIMRSLAATAGLDRLVEVDSAGTSGEHEGDRPDSRAVGEAAARNLDLQGLRARRVRPDDWDRFHLLLVADGMVERNLLRMAPASGEAAKVCRMTAFGPDAETVLDVPDPYYGGPDGFTRVYDVLERACTGLLDHVRSLVPPDHLTGTT